MRTRNKSACGSSWLASHGLSSPTPETRKPISHTHENLRTPENREANNHQKHSQKAHPTPTTPPPPKKKEKEEEQKHNQQICPDLPGFGPLSPTQFRQVSNRWGGRITFRARGPRGAAARLGFRGQRKNARGFFFKSGRGWVPLSRFSGPPPQTGRGGGSFFEGGTPTQQQQTMTQTGGFPATKRGCPANRTTRRTVRMCLGGPSCLFQCFEGVPSKTTRKRKGALFLHVYWGSELR